MSGDAERKRGVKATSYREKKKSPILLGALVDALHEGGEDILRQEGVVELSNESVQAGVGLLLVGLEETLDANLVVDLLDGNNVSLSAATVVLLFFFNSC
jgi:hypothetical protein